MCADKKCQATKTSDMWPVQPKMDMWSNRPVKLQSSYKKKDQDDFKSQSSMCSDKKCQETLNVQMRPKKPMSHKWSVTKKNDVWLPTPAVLYQYRRLCNDKNCQSTGCYKKRNYYKNCQSDNNMCFNKEIWIWKNSCHMQTALKTSVMQSIPKTDCKWIGTQPEVTRNIYSTSKH